MTNSAKDTLSICPKCGSDACYTTPLNNTANSYFCFGCGYQSNDLQKEGEMDFEMLEESMPDLYKDFKFVDEEKRVWYPSAINIPEKGTAFLNVSPNKSIEWCAIKVRSLTEAEQKELSNKNINYKSDASTLKFFGDDFIEALDYINFFSK